MAQTRIQTKPRQIDLSHVLVIGAWGFAIVIASMLFLYVGHMIDEMLNTPPTFMLGLVLPGAGALHRKALQGRLGPDRTQAQGQRIRDRGLREDQKTKETK